MKITVKTGLIFALIWITIKLGMFWSGIVDSQIAGSLINVFCLLSAISVGLFLSKLRSKEVGTALGDIKDGMKAGLLYTLIVSGFMYFFYGNIDKEFTDHKISERLTQTEKDLSDDVKWDDFKKKNSDYETYSKEQFYKEEKNKIEAANSPKAIFIMSLLAGLMLGTFYCILVTAIFRKIVFKNMYST